MNIESKFKEEVLRLPFRNFSIAVRLDRGSRTSHETLTELGLERVDKNDLEYVGRMLGKDVSKLFLMHGGTIIEKISEK